MGGTFFSLWQANDAPMTQRALILTQQTKWFEGRHVCHLCDARVRTRLTHKCRVPPVPFPPLSGARTRGECGAVFGLFQETPSKRPLDISSPDCRSDLAWKLVSTGCRNILISISFSRIYSFSTICFSENLNLQMGGDAHEIPQILPHSLADKL